MHTALSDRAAGSALYTYIPLKKKILESVVIQTAFFPQARNQNMRGKGSSVQWYSGTNKGKKTFLARGEKTRFLLSVQAPGEERAHLMERPGVVVVSGSGASRDAGLLALGLIPRAPESPMLLLVVVVLRRLSACGATCLERRQDRGDSRGKRLAVAMQRIAPRDNRGSR